MNDPRLPENEPVCDDVQAIVGPADEELSADERRRAEDHLAICETCRRRAETLWRQDRALVELAAEAVLAGGLAARIAERLRSAAAERAAGARNAEPEERSSNVRPAAGGTVQGNRARVLWALAAGVVVALGVWALRRPANDEIVRPGAVNPGGATEFARVETAVGRLLLVGDGGEAVLERGQPIAAGAVLQTAGEESLAVIRLADGTRLELRADTRIALHDESPAAGEPGKRIVLSDGFLAAEVAKQPEGRPMRLSTPQAELVVLGTKFQLSGGGELTYVGTAEGSVRVTRKSDGRSVVVAGGFETAIGETIDPAARPLPAASLRSRVRLDGFFASALSHDGRVLAASRFFGGEIHWWNVDAEQVIRVQPAQRRRVHAMAFAAGDTTLASGGVEGVIKVWDRRDGELKHSFAADGPWVADVAAVETGWGVLSGTEGSETRTFSVRAADGRAIQSSSNLNVQRWAFSNDGRRLATYDKRTKTITVRDVSADTQTTFPTPVGNNVFSMAFSHDGRMLAVDGSSGLIVLCEAATGRTVRRIERRGGRIFGMTFSHDGRLLATGHQDGTVRLWNVADGSQRAVSAGGPVHARATAFTPDGRKLVTREIRLAADGAPRDGAVTIWEIPEN